MSGAAREPTSATPESGERRLSERRRTYNRRSGDRELSPPYFEIFERIAVALEHIDMSLRGGEVTLPDVQARTRAERR